MACKTDTYTLELWLEAGPKDRKELDHRFFLGFRVYNCMVTEARKRLNAYYRDKDVKEIRKRMRKKGYELTEDEKKILSAARKAYGLEKFAFHAYLTPQGQKYSRYLDSNTVQCIGTRVWEATESVLFGKGREIHYKRYNDLTSLEGKDNKSGILFRGGLEWKGLSIPVRIRKRDLFAQEAIAGSRLKYCRIVRRKHGSGFRYSLQLVLEGMPPPKRNWHTGEFRHQPSQVAPDVVAGYDPGTSTLAAVSSAGIVWQEYGDDVGKEKKTIRKLQRKLDRQRKANNPERFTEDGQYIRYKRGQERPPWYESRRMRETRAKLSKAWRRRSARLKQSQYITANQIIETVGCHIVVEETNFSALARRSKQTKIRVLIFTTRT